MTRISTNTLKSYEDNIERLRSAKYSNLEKITSALKISVDDIFLSPNSEKPKMMTSV
ncbi:XRE family transcriptional regulator [Liquorilactobacillus mali]|uniref:HTH cro/C1-type domain-containing protein n=1 Tax=Liquorilactobacillus mali KCTC 3596 = DSM 20444 TaxID=1046596 RepID=J0L7K7_9LACO|nr:putative Xre family DNA-binding protein [Liquorilactobacillus mali KCTC 3596 = DSM 20444]KRN07875.1 hypothetical protein FD00_GL002501 [Liquorilactobacillus mali KCTC 3596 = DSM 20444]QFQ74592.1 XRE family transcriptional regulator [Liquorilactobacillus mali]